MLNVRLLKIAYIVTDNKSNDKIYLVNHHEKDDNKDHIYNHSFYLEPYSDKSFH